MNKELEVLIKIIRNSLILGGLYFVSIWAVGDLSFQVCKPLIVFLLTYIFTELAKIYKLDYPKQLGDKRKTYSTLVY